jgi:O-acetyl-ADP-ribose deacetylase
LGAESIAFPGISAGIFRFPEKRAAAIAIREARTFLDAHALPERILFVCYDLESYRSYEELMR